MLRKLLSASVCAFLVSTGAGFATCDPTSFTVQEINAFKYSDVLTLSAWDIMDTASESSGSKGFDLGAVIYGVPVNVGYDEAKQASSYMQKNSGIEFAQDQKLEFFQSNLSLVGERMYADCLARLSNQFTVKVNPIAYTEDGSFPVIVEWNARGTAEKQAKDVKATLIALNGSVDGGPAESVAIKDVTEKGAVFIVKRIDKKRSVTLIPTVDGISYGGNEYGSIVIPPRVDLQFETKLRTWPDEGDTFTALCSDDGGGDCGSDPHPDRKCLQAKDGMFLPSTYTYEWKSINAPAPTVEARSDSVCVSYSTHGVAHFGKGGYSAIQSLSFSIRELVPRGQQN